MGLPIATNAGNQVNLLGQYKELYVGAGARIFKANKEGVFLGGNNYSNALLRLGYDGTILAGDPAGLQVGTSGSEGKINFYYNSARVGYLVGINTGDMALDADKDLYFSADATQALRIVGSPAAGEVKGDIQLRQSSARITWNSLAARIGAENTSVNIIAGDLKIPADKAFYRGTDGGDTNTINYKDHSGNDATATVKGGIVISCT